MNETAQRLLRLFNEHKDRRICVVGGTCTGKTTLLQFIPEALDMDALVFPKLTPEERDYVCQTPWTPAIGQKMIELARKYVIITPGQPVFGTVVLPCDLIIHLTIDDKNLQTRAEMRSVNFKDAKNMNKQVEREVAINQTPTISFSVA